MELTISKITESVGYPYDLLYLADPSREAVGDYLSRGECWGAYTEDDILVGEYVLLPTRPFTAELVNIAVGENWQGQGIGKLLVTHFQKTARSRGYKKLEVGTADIGIDEIAFYEKCGFRIEWTDPDFFIKHYPDPVIDHGRQCRDMVRLGMDCL